MRHVPFSCSGVQGMSELRGAPCGCGPVPTRSVLGCGLGACSGHRMNRITRRCPELSTSYGRGQAAGAWCSVCGGDQGSGRGRGMLCDPRGVSQGAGCHQGGWAPSTHCLHVEGPGKCSLATAWHEASPCVCGVHERRGICPDELSFS